MKTPLYREALSHGWDLAWKNKILWFFGVFAALLGQMGIFDFLARIGASSNQAGLASGWVGPLGFGHVSSLVRGFPLPLEGWGWIFFAFLLAAGIILFLAVIAASSQGALIHATAQSVKSKKAINIQKAWYAGVGHAWKLLLLHIVKVFIMLLLGLAVGAAVFNAVVNPTPNDHLVFMVVFVLTAMVGMMVSFLVIYAAGYIVVEEYSVGQSILAAWRLFADHILVSIEVGVIFMLLNFLLVFGAGVGIFTFFFPAIILWAAALITSINALYIIGLVAGVVVFLTFVLLLGSVFNTFTTAAWTYLFMKMHKHGIKSRLVHFLSHTKS